MDQVVLLKVSQLSEALLAQVALEGPLAAVHSEMDLIGKQIAKKCYIQAVLRNERRLSEVRRRTLVP